MRLGAERKRSKGMEPLIRRAVADDFATWVDLVRGLATFERLAPPDEAAVGRLWRDGFGTCPRFEVWLVAPEPGQRPVGYAVVFETYSTFLARPTLYLEDLFVEEAWRGRGLGGGLLRFVLREAERRQCGRVEWTCLDWNEKAQRIYAALGAEAQREWWLYRKVLASSPQ